eukprot:TRINITY_DN18550_c0_g1_i1.p1 TRINITY_DN18550_c0_g1~~TRINITY_DN18550_c0_g1_i1.p1  ORF type:complete len:409 (-),score=151.89 TRINITY_DN18550_c0_g1_i1:658-1884(-)
MLERDAVAAVAPALCLGAIALLSFVDYPYWLSLVPAPVLHPLRFFRRALRSIARPRSQRTARGGFIGFMADAVQDAVAAVAGDAQEAATSSGGAGEGSRLPLPIAVGVGAVQGRRPYMEDRHSISLGFGDPENPSTTARCFFGVYDGHGGEAASTWCKNKLHGNLRARPEFPADMPAAMHHALLQTDEEFLSSATSLDDGTTVVFAVLDTASGELWVANAGDSRGIICRRGIGVALSEDHKPDRPDERQRIEAQGGMVQQATLFGKHMGPYRVYTGRRTGGLAVSRGLGDAHLKNNRLVIAEPEIKHFRLTPTDEFMVLATDGLWDVFSNQQACDFVRKFYNGSSRTDPEEVADLLVNEALKQGSLDNVTALIVYFTEPERFSGPEADLSDVRDVDTSTDEFALHRSV